MDFLNEFVAWATRPELNLEEAFCAERLVEVGLEFRRVRHEGLPPTDWEARRDFLRRRRLNPAHRVRITSREARDAYEGLVEMRSLDLSAWEDRPLRDISGLRFLPHFRTLALHRNELTDLSPLAGWRDLRHLALTDDALEDLTPLGELGDLQQLWVRLRLPWPDVAALGRLERLEEIHWSGNLLVLENVPRLPAVRIAEFATGWETVLPSRDCTRLPEMPWVESLILERVHRLDGVTRWPRLRFLAAGGSFRDLEPLTALRHLTHLQLDGDVTRDLAPLVRLPLLRRLVVRGNHPQDYSVLAEAPRLHEVVAEGCQINRMELATLHAVLPKWDEEFATPSPARPGPLAFRAVPHDQLPHHPRWTLEPAASWDGDLELAASENRWMSRRLEQALGKLLGDGWGAVAEWGRAPGSAAVRVASLDAAERLAEIVECIRRVLAAGRWPWLVQLRVDLEESTAATPESGASEEDVVRQELENQRLFKRRQREQQILLEREHRLRLLQQEGQVVDPRRFLAPEAGGEEAAEEGDATTVEVAGDYSLAENLHPLAEQLFVLGVVSAAEFVVSHRCRAAAEHLLHRRPDGAAPETEAA